MRTVDASSKVESVSRVNISASLLTSLHLDPDLDFETIELHQLEPEPEVMDVCDPQQMEDIEGRGRKKKNNHQAKTKNKDDFVTFELKRPRRTRVARHLQLLGGCQSRKKGGLKDVTICSVELALIIVMLAMLTLEVAQMTAIGRLVLAFSPLCFSRALSYPPEQNNGPR